MPSAAAAATTELQLKVLVQGQPPFPPQPQPPSPLAPGWRKPDTIFLRPATDKTVAAIMADSAVSPRSSIAHSRRHSRKSTGNINFSQMSLSPLTSGTVITDQDFCRKERRGREGSYIQGLSVRSYYTMLLLNLLFDHESKKLAKIVGKKKNAGTHHSGNIEQKSLFLVQEEFLH